MQLISRTLLALTLSLFACLSLATETTKASSANEQQNPKVVFSTEYGDVVIELYPQKAPKTVENFLNYVNRGFYDGTIFHRVLPGFVVQGGGFRFDFSQKETDAPVINESFNKLKNLTATISMARLPNPDSGTSQFFINLADNPHLDPRGKEPGYTVFGKVIEGFDSIRKIEKEPQGLYRDPRFTNTPNIKPQILKARKVK